MEATEALIPNKQSSADQRQKKLAITYFVIMTSFHMACFLAFSTGVTWTAFTIFLLSYAMKAMGITTGFHRYFSHRSFKTNRPFQFILGLFGTTAVGGVYGGLLITEPTINTPIKSKTFTLLWPMVFFIPIWVGCGQKNVLRKLESDAKTLPDSQKLNF